MADTPRVTVPWLKPAPITTTDPMEHMRIALIRCRDFIAEEAGQREEAGSHMSDYYNEANDYLDVIDGALALATREEAPACKKCGGKGYTEHEDGEGEGYPSRPEIEACSCRKEAPAEAGDDELIERGLRMIRAYDAVRDLRDALSATTARLSGYDWNADPEGLTKRQGHALAAADKVFSDLDAAVASHPEIELPECQTCGGTGKIEEAARTEGANQHSACVRTCDDCDGCGFAPDDGSSALRAQPPAREDSQPVAWLVGEGGGTIMTRAAAWAAGKRDQGVSVTPLYTHPAPDAMRGAEEALDPFARIASEGVIRTDKGHVTVTTCAEYFHAAVKALAALQAEQKVGG